MGILIEVIGGRKAVIALFVGLIIGIIVGLPILGWGLWPVKWTDADPYDMRVDHKQEYVAMVVDSYALNRDADLAKKRLAGWNPNEVNEILGKLRAGYVATDRDVEAENVDDLTAVLRLGTTATPPAQPTATGELAVSAGKSLASRLLPFCIVLMVLILVVVIAVLILRLLRRRGAREATTPDWAQTEIAPGQVPAGPDILGNFTSTYDLGYDNYDQSFSIETPDGAFLGECGVGISETIGTGTPAKVTAFEVWLFDKSDIRTITKVLMSEHAYNDDALRAKLAPKGEPVLARPGERIILETTSLRVEAEVKEMSYDPAASPLQSHFTKLVTDLTARLKQSNEPETAPL